MACSSIDSVEPDGGGASAQDLGLGPVTGLAEKDLAIAFALTSTALPAARDRVAGDELLPAAWYSALDSGFRTTSIGDVVVTENERADWRVVSVRVAPCAPLTPAPTATSDQLCWPEVRLVWQPILRNVTFHARFSAAFADDRAVHAIYPAPEASALTTVEASRARALRATIATAAAAWHGGPFAPLSAAELAEFTGLRDRVTRALLDATLALRGSGVPAAAFAGHGVRPESTGTVAAQTALRSRVLTFFATYARPGGLDQLTAFSQPEGREPAASDEWVFIAFKATAGRLVPAPVRLTSITDGRVLFDFAGSVTGSMGGDDPRLDEAVLDPATRAEIAGSVLLSTSADLARLRPVLSDRRQRLVPNTTCDSCHRLNPLRFDFHNFGYLEDRDLTVSPRVTTDVALDLAWLARLGG